MVCCPVVSVLDLFSLPDLQCDGQRCVLQSLGLTGPVFRLTETHKRGLVGFMGYGDLWRSESTVLIFCKSRAGIYGDLYHPKDSDKRNFYKLN